jgi:hypothetical protein
MNAKLEVMELRWKWQGGLPQLVGGVGLGLILAMSVPGQLQAQTPGAPGPDGDLAVDTRTADGMTGEYGLAGSLVTYDARRTGPERATVSLTVNGKRLDATVDFAARTGSWTGHGTILGSDGKTALAGMERALTARLTPGRAQLGPHEALLYRAVMLWAEAPAGHVLNADSFSKPAEGAGDRDDARAGSQPGGEPCLDPVTGRVSVAACQQANANGIAYFAAGCSGGSALECHDAESHCWTCTVVSVGKAANCKGRCGGGCCIPDGLGIYTYDCLDHDECCGDHGGCFNPWDSECGDEYGEADDDFWLASPNCGWQC